MAKKMIIFLFSFLLIMVSLSCSKGPDNKSEKGAVDQLTHKVANDALHTIQDPINQAKALENIGIDRQKMIDESLSDE